MCFVDFTKAFNIVRHAQLWVVMLEMGFPPHIVEILRNLYKQQTAAVKTAGLVSNWFRVKKGVRQGCVLSPCLFNIMAEIVMRRVLDDWSGGFKIGGLNINNLRYADDIVLIAESEEELQELLDRLIREGKQYNLFLNASKTKVMSNTGKSISIMADGVELEVVDVFQYLGANISNNAECRTDIKKRLAMASSIITRLKPTLCNNLVSTNTKWRLVKALVWPVATYGCESWTLRKVDEQKILAFENKCARRLLRIPWTAKKTNEAVWEMLKEKPALLSHIKTRKLRYYGHIVRQEELSVEGAVMTGLVPGNRNKGKPRTAWLDNIANWTGLTGAQMLQMTRDRSVWRFVIHQSVLPSSLKTD